MKHLTTAEFDQFVTNQPYAVVKYWAPWCKNCYGVGYYIAAVAATTPEIPFYAVNIDEEPELKARAKLKAIPALLFYKDGRIHQFIIGLSTEENIRHKLKMLTFK